MATREQPNQRKKGNFRKHLWYWVRVSLVIALGIYLGHLLNEGGYGFRWRCWVYQHLHSLNPQHPKPRRTVLVLIGDEEYWNGEPAARVPIKRDYLAKLVRAAAASNPAVIALDFDLRSPSPEGNPVEFPIYQAETTDLLEAVRETSQDRTIVLPKTLGVDASQNYVSESDIYNGFDFKGGRVRTGYIALPDDTRQVPLTLSLGNGELVHSFSQIIAEADNPKVVSDDSEVTSLPYGSYIRTEEFTVVPAGDLLSTDPEVMQKVRSALEFKLVILGGNWHVLGPNRGVAVDSYETPVGNIPGVFIHANYAEALLGARIFRTWKGWVLTLTEITLALIVALPFALKIRPWWKNLLAITLPYLIIIAVSYFSLMNFGLFFDPFIPLILVGVHGAVEQILEWREGGKPKPRKKKEKSRNKAGKEEQKQAGLAVVEEQR